MLLVRDLLLLAFYADHFSLSYIYLHLPFSFSFFSNVQLTQKMQFLQLFTKMTQKTNYTPTMTSFKRFLSRLCLSDTRHAQDATQKLLLSFSAGLTNRHVGRSLTSESGSTTPCGGTSTTSGWPTSPLFQEFFLSLSLLPSSSCFGRARCGTSSGSSAAFSSSAWWRRPMPVSCAKTWWWCSCRCTLLFTWPACCLQSTSPSLRWTRAAGERQADVRL